MDQEPSALKQLIESGEFLRSMDLDRKTVGLVFDKRTLIAIYEMMGKYSIDYIDFPISSGKESVVFKAYSRKKPVVLKVFKMSTLKFSKIGMYIEGDYRFSKERIDRSKIVFLWAKKEFTNLRELYRNKISCPKPIGFHKNLLLMSYIGTKTSPAPLIKDISVDPETLYVQVREMMKRMYEDAKLIHADLSEYNILYYRKKPYFIDLGQAVPYDHPSAEFFLKRDVKNISHYFSKLGVSVSMDELYHYITGLELPVG